MITQDNLPSMLSMIIPHIIELIMEDRAIDAIGAAKILYGSELYNTLEIEDTKLWHLSPITLFDLLNDELNTGSITWPEEQ